jgi:hypothetical protein
MMARVRKHAVRLPLALLVLAVVLTALLLGPTGQFRPISGSQAVLVGQALLGAAGKVDAGQVLASYPPVAMLPLVGLQAVTGLAGFTTATLLSAALAAGLAALWLRSLLLTGYGVLAAFALTALLCLNPLFLLAAGEGPELMMTLWGAWIFGISAFDVRARGGVNDLMLCSGSLMLLAFSGQPGILFVAATLPFLPLVMPADVQARSWLSVYLVLLFPAGFALLGFMLVNWMMLHDPLAFLRPQIEASGEWFGGSWARATAEIVSAVAAAPILLGLFILARDRRPIQAVAMAMLGTIMLLALLALQTGVGLSLTAALSPAIGLAAAAAMRWPTHRRRTVRALILLALGMIGGGSALYAQSYAVTSGSQIHDSRRDAADRDLGRFLADKDHVMIDAAAHPQVVAGRGSAEGLITASETAFKLSMLRRRIGPEPSAVAVRATDPSRGADTIGRNIPAFHDQGTAGFRVIYDRDGWRVWSRVPQRDDKQ